MDPVQVNTSQFEIPEPVLAHNGSCRTGLDTAADALSPAPDATLPHAQVYHQALTIMRPVMNSITTPAGLRQFEQMVDEFIAKTERQQASPPVRDPAELKTKGRPKKARFKSAHERKGRRPSPTKASTSAQVNKVRHDELSLFHSTEVDVATIPPAVTLNPFS
ncbi:unnamed protein product [Tilletia laevis]|nr:unnamed protein product [Tilletia laevis]